MLLRLVRSGLPLSLSLSLSFECIFLSI
jgi:hypothetical protein